MTAFICQPSSLKSVDVLVPRHLICSSAVDFLATERADDRLILPL